MLPSFFKLVKESQYNVMSGTAMLRIMVEHDISREEFAEFCGKDYKHICGLLSKTSKRFKTKENTSRLYENSLQLLVKIKEVKKADAIAKDKEKKKALEEKIMDINGVPTVIKHNEIQTAETKMKILEALRVTSNVDEICSKTGIGKTTIYKYLNEDEDLKQMHKDKNNASVGEILEVSAELAMGKLRKLDEDGNFLGYEYTYPDDKARKDVLKYMKSDFKDTTESNPNSKFPQVPSMLTLNFGSKKIKDVSSSTQDDLVIDEEEIIIEQD